MSVAISTSASLSPSAFFETFARLVEAVPMGVALVDGDGRIVLVNRRLTDLLGFSGEALLGIAIDNLLVSETPEAQRDVLRRCFETPSSWTIGQDGDLHAARRDGTTFPAEIGLNPVDTPQGPHVLATFVDIGARHKLEIAVADSHHRLQQIIDAAPVGIVKVDETGRIELANRHLAEMFGYQATELLNQNIDILIPSGARAGHAHHVGEYFAKPSCRSMGTGMTVYGARRDGSLFPIEVGLSPVKTYKGVFVLATVINITSRRAIEVGATNERLQMKAVLDAASEVSIIATDLHGLITIFNTGAEKMLGYRAEELVGLHPLSMIFDPEEVAERAAELSAQLGQPISGFETLVARTAAQGHDEQQWTYIRRDGQRLTVNLLVTPKRDASGAVTGYLCIGQDLTAKHRQMAELRQANESLEQFSYVVSHDLRSPLRGIADLVEWIREDLGADPPQNVAHNLDRITTRIQRMETLITDLLTYARASQIEADTTRIDPAELVQNVLELDPPPAGFTVELRLPPLSIMGARAPLETVFRNLIGNAFKHHDRSWGNVSITAKARGAFVEFQVADDGPGIPPRSQERVLKLFQTATAPERKGSGVGLAVAKRLIESHGGDLKIISSDDRRGTEFRFRWPIHSGSSA